jgi:hypothetical protein
MSAAAAAPAPAAAAAADDDRCAPAVCCIPPRADTPRCGGVADCEPALVCACCSSSTSPRRRTLIVQAVAPVLQQASLPQQSAINAAVDELARACDLVDRPHAVNWMCDDGVWGHAFSGASARPVVPTAVPFATDAPTIGFGGGTSHLGGGTLGGGTSHLGGGTSHLGGGTSHHGGGTPHRRSATQAATQRPPRTGTASRDRGVHAALQFATRHCGPLECELSAQCNCTHGQHGLGCVMDAGMPLQLWASGELSAAEEQVDSFRDAVRAPPPIALALLHPALRVHPSR